MKIKSIKGGGGGPVGKRVGGGRPAGKRGGGGREAKTEVYDQEENRRAQNRVGLTNDNSIRPQTAILIGAYVSGLRGGMREREKASSTQVKSTITGLTASLSWCSSFCQPGHHCN